MHIKNLSKVQGIFILVGLNQLLKISTKVDDKKNTFPNINGINSVTTRLLSSCLVGIDIPTPAATNFVIVNGTYKIVESKHTTKYEHSTDGKLCYKKQLAFDIWHIQTKKETYDTPKLRHLS